MDNKQESVDSGFSFRVSNSGGNMPLKLPSKRDDPEYNMKHPFRGRCVILNYRKFDHLDERKGTDKDAEHLDSTFRALNFNVEIFQDKTHDETLKIFQTESARNQTKNDCFVMCILSHGGAQKSAGNHAKDCFFFNCKDKPFNLEKIFEYFAGSRCPSLVGKPKLFFIQACRGDRLDSGVLVHDGLQNNTCLSSPFLIPNFADFLMVYSTFPGHLSWRCGQNGSWFMQTLCEVLKEFHGSNQDLMTQLTIVCRRVAFNFESSVQDPEMNRKKQIPCIMSTLTRLIRF